ncbi:hypothetical protein Pint_35857 [Pistacia integerrima]|uniref:Uncharacterized protein n=1 Tax=Pistacia integerrima TaxID=434235 RepID=A0ACC0XYJ6_9ROSI|nr:hypothetical protein Pint_35857 [Pistacia integerrima]
MAGNRDDFEDAEDDVGLSLEKLNLGPKKKLLVNSPSGVLIHRAHLANNSSIPNARTPDAHYGGHLVFKRPFSEEFMRFCFQRFEVGVWSSAKESPHTAIFPHTYNVEAPDDDILSPKGELIKYLEGLAEADDVQSHVKENPFWQSAVNPSHPDWGFYCKVIRELQRE